MTKTRVLVADEHPAFREGVKQAINNTVDMEVIATVEDGECAVMQAAEQKPDVAILSITLPKIDGLATTRKLKEINPSISIILFSLYSHGSYIVPALRAGAMGYLSKTSPLEDLIDCIRSVKAGETVVKSDAVGKILRLFSESEEEYQYVEKLHLREMEVLSLVAKGMHNHDIAAKLNVSDHTVHTHLASIFRKLGVDSRTGAVMCALKKGWINIDDLA